MVQVPPDKALFVLRKGEVRKIASGGSIFVNPLTETYTLIPLNVRTLDLNLRDVESSLEHKRAPFNIKMVTQVKVSSHIDSLYANALRLIAMTDEEINSVALGVLEDLFRRYAKHKTPLEISEARNEAARSLMSWANDELRDQGIEVRSLVIKELEDENGYFETIQLTSVDEWLWATYDNGRLIPDRRKELIRRVKARRGEQ